MKVLLHMLVDVPGAQSFGSAARTAASLAKSTGKVTVEAASIEEATVVSPSMLATIKDAVEAEISFTIRKRSGQAHRVCAQLQ